MKRTLTILALVVLAAFAAGATDCNGNRGRKPVSAKVVIPAVNAGVEEFKNSIPDLGLSDEDARLLSAAFEEAKLSGPLAERAANFSNLSRADRIRLSADVAEHLSATAQRLSNQNIGLKSDRAKATLVQYRSRIRLAAAALRIYAAAVEGGEDPDALPPSPSPTPAQ